MTMYGKVQPDHLGRPHQIWFSKHAATIIGPGRYRLEQQGDMLLLHPDPAGRTLTKARTIAAGAVLDGFNRDGRLTNEPFPIRRRSGSQGIFELALRAPDPNLSTRGVQRDTALPMQVVDQPALQRQPYSTDDLVRLFALLTIIQGENLDEQAWRDSPDDLLRRLPAHGTVMARFGSFTRFHAFVEFQVGRMRRAHLGEQAAHDELERLLDR